MATTIGAPSRLSPEVVRQAPRDVEILRHHARGKSYKEIAKRFGYANASGPQKRVARLQRITALHLDPFYWAMEMHRLEDLHYALHFDAFGPGVSTRRQLAASKLMLKILDLETELTAGLTVVPDHRQPVDGTDVDTVLQSAHSVSSAYSVCRRSTVSASSNEPLASGPPAVVARRCPKPASGGCVPDCVGVVSRLG